MFTYNSSPYDMNSAPSQHVEELRQSQGEMRVDGFISLEGAYSRVRVHVLLPVFAHTESYIGIPVSMYVASAKGATSPLIAMSDVNRHPLETCELHRSIDAVFARSSFSKHVLLYAI